MVPTVGWLVEQLGSENTLLHILTGIYICRCGLIIYTADGIYLNFQRCTRRELKRSGQKACKRKLGQQPRTATRSLDHPSHDEATQLACSSGHPIWQAMHKGPLLTRRGNSATNCPTTWVHI